MSNPTVPLPPPPEKPGKSESTAGKLIPFALALFLLSLGYYFSVLFIKHEIKVRKISPTPIQTEDNSSNTGVSPVFSGFTGEPPQNGDPEPARKGDPSPTPGTGSTPPASDDTPSASPMATSSTSPSPIPFHKRINLNTAKADDFTNLPGLGVKKSLAIIEYRRNNGPFKTTEDIMKVKGIGKKLYEKIKPWIYVE